MTRHTIKDLAQLTGKATSATPKKKKAPKKKAPKDPEPAPKPAPKPKRTRLPDYVHRARVTVKGGLKVLARYPSHPEARRQMAILEQVRDLLDGWACPTCDHAPCACVSWGLVPGKSNEINTVQHKCDNPRMG